MKAIVCEMCNSRDLVKQDGFYVCQACGTKYSVEDAKKMMIEVDGPLDVSGSTVKVDNKDSLANLRQLARRARETGNAANAAKYYEMVAMQDPQDWEASFYSVYYAAAGCTIAQIASAANSVTNALPTTMQLIKQKLPESEQKAAYMAVVNSTINLCSALDQSASAHYSKYSSVQGAGTEYEGRRFASYQMLFTAGNLINKLFEDKQTAVLLYQKCYASGAYQKEKLNQLIAELDPELGRSNELGAKVKDISLKGIIGSVLIFLAAVGLFARVIISTPYDGEISALDIIGLVLVALAALCCGLAISGYLKLKKDVEAGSKTAANAASGQEALKKARTSFKNHGGFTAVFAVAFIAVLAGFGLLTEVLLYLIAAVLMLAIAVVYLVFAFKK